MTEQKPTQEQIEFVKNLREQIAKFFWNDRDPVTSWASSSLPEYIKDIYRFKADSLIKSSSLVKCCCPAEKLTDDEIVRAVRAAPRRYFSVESRAVADAQLAAFVTVGEVLKEMGK